MRPTSRLVGASLVGLFLITPAGSRTGTHTMRPASTCEARSSSRSIWTTLMNVNVTTASKWSETLSDAPGVISVVTGGRAAAIRRDDAP